MSRPPPNKHRKNFESPIARIVFALLMMAIGCVLPIVIIQTQNQIPQWKVGALELFSLGGLAILMVQLVLKTKMPLQLYASMVILGLLIIDLIG